MSRKGLGITQTDLAKRAKTTRATISNIERGGQALSLDLFVRIAGALNVQAPDFLASILKGHEKDFLNEVPDDVRHYIVSIMDKEV